MDYQMMFVRYRMRFQAELQIGLIAFSLLLLGL
jgi:hypothetical protein